MKKIFSKTKQRKSTVKDGIVLQFFKYISVFGLIEDSWILRSASVFSLLWYVVLVEECEETN